MFAGLGIVVAELVVMYFLSKRLMWQLYGIFLLVTRSRTVSMAIVAAILFPGTVIHELSHMFTAEVLGVPTGKLTLVPETLEGRDVRAGSVTIGRSDPFRRAAIGIAPFVTGVAALTGLSYWLTSLTGGILTTVGSGSFSPDIPHLLVVFILYLIFTVSNSMYTSPEDMNGVLPVIIITGIAIITAIITIGINVPEAAAGAISDVLASMYQYLGIILGVNLAFLTVGRILILAIQRVVHRKLV